MYTTMFRLSDFVTCRKRYYNQSGVYSSALEHCRIMEFRTYIHLTLIAHFHVPMVD